MCVLFLEGDLFLVGFNGKPPGKRHMIKVHTSVLFVSCAHLFVVGLKGNQKRKTHYEDSYGGV